MSALQQPPPLPDVPFARVVPDGSGASVPYLLRPVSRAARFLLALPLPLMGVLSVLLLLKQYRSGASFTHDTNHTFIFFFDAIVFGVLSGVVLAAAAVAIGCAWRRLDRPGRRRAGGCGAAALAAGVLALWFSGDVFQWGKSRAYAAVNPLRLVSDCTAMASALAAQQPPRSQSFVEGAHPSVPAYVRSLAPRYVSVTAGQVEVIMSHDFVSGAYNESFIVPLTSLATEPQSYAAQKRLTVLSVQPPVFRSPAPR